MFVNKILKYYQPFSAFWFLCLHRAAQGYCSFELFFSFLFHFGLFQFMFLFFENNEFQFFYFSVLDCSFNYYFNSYI